MLRDMGCPASLQSSQISGKHFDAMLPVVRWLVTRVLEYRAAHSASARAGSETHFEANYFVPRTVVPHSTDFLGLVQDRYAAKRQYRRNAGMWRSNLDAGARIACALLEYGERIDTGRMSGTQRGSIMGGAGEGGQGGGATAGHASDRKLAKAQKAAEARAKAQAEKDKAMQEEILSGMSSSGGGGGSRLSGDAVGGVLSLQADALRAQTAQYSARAEELQRASESGELLANTAMGRAQAHTRKVASLRRRLAVAEAKRDIAAEEASAAEESSAALRQELSKRREYGPKLQAALDAIAHSVEEMGQGAVFAKIRKLQHMQGTLATQEEEFKANCRRKAVELEQELAGLKVAAAAAADGAAGSQSESKDGARLSEIEAAYSETLAKQRRLRGMLARRSREVDRLQRLIDDVPSRGELLQYERRFMELYDTMARQMEELRAHYTTFNATTARRKYLEHEDSLLSSMGETFEPAMKSTTGTGQFMSSVGGALDGLRASLAEQQGILRERRLALETTRSAHGELKAAQRAYVRAVKDFTAACEENEALTAAQQQ